MDCDETGRIIEIKSTVEGKETVKRGENSWSFIYLIVFSIWNSTIIAIITLLPLRKCSQIILIIIATIIGLIGITNPWIQDRILRFKNLIEKPR